MRTMLVLAILVLAVFMTGCAVTVAPVMPPFGIAFTNTTAPLDVNYDKTELGSKTGKASTYSILGLFAFGDASTEAAARAGGIKVVNHADYASLNVLFLFGSYTTIVYGD